MKAKQWRLIARKRDKAAKVLSKHRADVRAWNIKHSRGRPRLELMYEIGRDCSRAKTSATQTDWASDLRVANKAGEHAEPGYKPGVMFSRVRNRWYTAHQAAVWKQEVSNLCRGRK